MSGWKCCLGFCRIWWYFLDTINIVFLFVCLIDPCFYVLIHTFFCPFFCPYLHPHLGWPGGVGLGPWCLFLSRFQVRCQLQCTSLASSKKKINNRKICNWNCEWKNWEKWAKGHYSSCINRKIILSYLVCANIRDPLVFI